MTEELSTNSQKYVPPTTREERTPIEGAEQKERIDYDNTLATTFEDLELKDTLLRGIYSAGYEKPSVIQQKAILPVLHTHDIIAQAQSGTGKTATFSIGLLNRIDETVQKTQGLVLAHTRELALQIYNVMNGLSQFMNVTYNLSVGGTLTYNDVTNIDSIGIITARSGVSIADSIFHTGDTNTSIRFPAADTFSVETAGSERLRIDSSGEVGIGTVLPGNALHVFKNGDGQTPVLFETSNATGKLRFYNDSNGWSIDSEGDLRFVGGRSGSGAPVSLHIKSAGAATFTAGLAEKYENAGTTLGSQPNNPLSDGNVILFTGNESGNKTINFTGVHATLSNGETVSFTAIITPNGSGVINVVQVDGQAITVKWSGGSAPSAGSAGQDIYTFQIIKTGTGVSNYTVLGAATNYA